MPSTSEKNTIRFDTTTVPKSAKSGAIKSPAQSAFLINSYSNHAGIMRILFFYRDLKTANSETFIRWPNVIRRSLSDKHIAGLALSDDCFFKKIIRSHAGRHRQDHVSLKAQKHRISAAHANHLINSARPFASIAEAGSSSNNRSVRRHSCGDNTPAIPPERGPLAFKRCWHETRSTTRNLILYPAVNLAIIGLCARSPSR